MSAIGQPTVPGFRGPLAVRNFRLLWVGETVSMVGDQFYFVALPWLVLQLTGSGLALGSVLMTAAIPCAAVMLVSNVMRAMVVSILTVLVFTDSARMWHLYALAAAFGTFDAFFYPADIAMVPSMLEPEQMVAGNSLVQASVQLASLIGPTAAGVVIGRAGVAAAFGVDAATFVVSIVMLALITTGHVAAAARQEPLLTSIRKGISHALAHATIRSLLVAYAMM